MDNIQHLRPSKVLVVHKVCVDHNFFSFVTIFSYSQSNLFNRCQKVQYDNFLSAEEKVFSGVPQGSIIGPLLFVLFYNDFVPNCLKHSKCVIYADDTVIYVPGKDIFIIESRLSDDMNRIANWCTQNELILNLKRGKTEAMLFGTSKRLATQPENLNVIFTYRSVSFTTSYKYLGIEINSTFNMNSYFDIIYKKSTSRLRILYKIRPFMTANCARTLYQSMILPLLTYCGTLQLNYNNTQCKKLDSLHKRALNIVNSNESVTSPLILNKIHALVLVQKCLRGSICTNFKNYFEITNHVKNTRNSGYLLKLPKLKLEFSRSSFYYMGATLFNELPHSIRMVDDLEHFKRALHKHYVG